MKKKYGFTLTELLVVIVIISVISAIVIPSYILINKNINERLYNTKIDIIVSSAKSYVSDNPDVFYGEEYVKVYVGELINNNYLEVEETDSTKVSNCEKYNNGSSEIDTIGCIYDPRNKNISLNNEYVLIHKENIGYSYNFDGEIPEITNGDSFTIIYYGNGGTSDDNNDNFYHQYIYGENDKLEDNIFNKEGYSFSGWCNNSNCNDKTYSSDTLISDLTIGNNRVIYLYAYWIEEAKYITISLNGNGSTSSIIIKLNTNEYSPTIVSPSKKYVVNYLANGTGANITRTNETIAYGFNGWYSASTNGSKVIDSSGNLIANVSGYTDANGRWIKDSTTILYAQWTMALLLPTGISKANNVCAWNTLSNGTGITYIAYEIYGIIKDLDLYAICYNSQNSFAYTGNIQTYTAPVNGIYELYVWGAGGGINTFVSMDAGYTYYTNYSYGGFSYGKIELTKNEKLYIVVGGKGVNSEYSTSGTGGAGGYNGGGTGGKSLPPSYEGTFGHCGGGGGGGGATHIATTTGLLKNLSSNRDSVLIVAGGGGGIAVSWMQSTSCPSTAGHGGGFSGVNIFTAGGTQSSGYAFGQGEAGKNSNFDSSNGCDSYGGGGAGGGWYGGNTYQFYANGLSANGTGGSGYIGNSRLTNKYMTCYDSCVNSSNTDTLTYSINSECPAGSPDSTCVVKENGYAKINLVEIK